MARIDGMRWQMVSVLMGLSIWMGGAMAQVPSWGLPDLMQTLAKQKSAKAMFTEKKFIAFVDQPLESSGELSYTAPDRLEKHTLQPKPESLVLNDDRLIIDRPGKRRLVISTQSRPEAAAFIESIRGTLAGDLNALQKYYTVDLEGNASAWKLTLVPKQPDMLKIMSRIRIDGAQDAVTFIVFEQADGDRSEMRIVKTTTP